MLDGNTAALNAYQREQERLDLAAEIAADDEEMRIDDLVMTEIEADSFVALEAIGTEATLDSINHPNKELKKALIDAIDCKGSNSQHSADKDLGKIFRELSYKYIAKSIDL